MYIRPLPEYLLDREDTIASHIRNCHEAATNAANMACYGSGWGGPGEEGFSKLREASNLLIQEIDKQIIEDILIDQLEGFDGPSDCFEDGYNAYGYVSIRH
jgi:hypothetical protein